MHDKFNFTAKHVVTRAHDCCTKFWLCSQQLEYGSHVLQQIMFLFFFTHMHSTWYSGTKREKCKVGDIGYTKQKGNLGETKRLKIWCNIWVSVMARSGGWVAWPQEDLALHRAWMAERMREKVRQHLIYQTSEQAWRPGVCRNRLPLPFLLHVGKKTNGVKDECSTLLLRISCFLYRQKASGSC